MVFQIKKLGDCLLQFDRGISWSRKDEGGTTAVLRIPNIEEGEINLDDLKYIATKNQNGKLERGDIVMVASNGNPELVGRSALVGKKEEGMRFASFLVRLKLDGEKLLPQYTHYFLLTRKFKVMLRSKIATTSGIYNLRKEHIEKIELPVPPLETQRQIIERLDKITETQKVNDQLIQKADELFQSLLHQEFNPASKNWKVKKIKDVAVVKNGGTPNTKNPKYWNGKVLWLTPKELSGFEGIEISDTERKISDDGLQYSSATLLPRGTVLLTSRAPIGYIAIAGAPMATNQGFKNFVCDSKQLNNRFLYFFLRLKTKYLQSLGRGATFTEISKTTVEKIDIPLPHLETQKQIVAKLSIVQNYKRQLLEYRAKLGELFSASLAKSLAGELVKEKVVITPAKVNVFPVWQAIGAVLKRLERGEMVVAKLLYLAQEIYKVPLGFSFTSQNFGPYDLQIKKAITAGASSRNKFFERKNGVYGLGDSAEKLFRYNSKILNGMKVTLNDLMPAIKNSTSAQIECLATVCKIIQDTKSDDLVVIEEKMNAWKPNKFKKQEIEGTLNFVKSRGWNKILNP